MHSGLDRWIPIFHRIHRSVRSNQLVCRIKRPFKHPGNPFAQTIRSRAVRPDEPNWPWFVVKTRKLRADYFDDRRTPRHRADGCRDNEFFVQRQDSQVPVPIDPPEKWTSTEIEFCSTFSPRGHPLILPTAPGPIEPGFGSAAFEFSPRTKVVHERDGFDQR
jgi:hypothetical protein